MKNKIIMKLAFIFLALLSWVLAFTILYTLHLLHQDWHDGRFVVISIVFLPISASCFILGYMTFKDGVIKGVI